MPLFITPETEERLRERAIRVGLDVNSLADTLLAAALANDPDDLTDEEISQIRAGIRRGLEAAAAGRVKPLPQAVADARQRHGLPDSWASGVGDGTAT